MNNRSAEELQFKAVAGEDSGILELTSGNVANERDAIDLIGNATFLGAEWLLVAAERLAPEFFDLSSGLAGEVVQKCANYRVCLVVVGYDAADAGESLTAFISEGNRGSTVWFVSGRDEALERIATRRNR